jgi:hypothetical protein
VGRQDFLSTQSGESQDKVQRSGFSTPPEI